MSLEKTPVTVVTGFLGAGKTTLIRHLLQNPQGRRLAVLVNEFGDVGVDGDLIRACADSHCPEANIVELTNGCICCTVADEFIPSIERLLALDPRPDHIVIETSGLALPKPLLKAFDWPDLRSRITIDGVVAVADAEAVAAGRFAPDPARPGDASEVDHETPLSEVFEDQIACADIVLLSKADLAGEEGVAAAREVISAEAPRPLPMVALTEGVIDPCVVLGINAAAEDSRSSASCAASSPPASHSSDNRRRVGMGSVEAASSTGSGWPSAGRTASANPFARAMRESSSNP